ncbi:acetyltransferase, GNAT family protein [Spiroplasma gladiatoris]|uniref:Acetyltransferase, GNAT family protein n=1 Tax=Spiroplasma gladiatoris TaxID=2143 RepID=A0A4P7AJR3_9MOLU|nr:GNAT family N-acetyltransferase [Spiroplasma gladiatoris]QBQ08058.1 acetyltransferase, GNAT family protein [Spiroplasma gladiatoris]
MSNLTFKVEFSVDNIIFFHALNIRKIIFVDEQKATTIDNEIDDYDEFAYHVVGFLNNEPICCARIFLKDNRYFLGRVGVIKEQRNKNIGKKLILFIIEYMKEELEARSLYIHAQINALNFYKSLNFKEFGEEFLEANIKHINMKLDI